MTKYFYPLAMLLAGICLIGCSTENKKDFKLSYDKFVLDNGLEVVLHQDKSDPIVAVAIQYHVGSNREKAGKTGFAHFFEHMLFQRSENLPRNAFFNKIDDLGGTFNGGTWSDGTIYYEQVPNDALEKILWMESDRMGFFINTVSQQGLEREVDVVINEKRERVDNNPYGHTEGVMKKALYPEGHPYNWTVIGEIADLRSATIDDVKHFYNDFYAPNNATLVIAGDFDKAQAKEWVNTYFGEIKARKEQAKPSVNIPTLAKEVRLMHEDKFAKMPELTLTYPAPEMYNKDSYALGIMSSLIAGSKKAPIYKLIVESKKLAPGVSMNMRSSEISGEVSLKVRAFPGKSLNDVYEAIQQGFKEFEAKGIDPQDLQRIKNMQETGFYNGISSIMDKATLLANSNVFGGSPDKFLDEVKVLNTITEADIKRVYEQYIKGKNCVITSFVPMGQGSLALANSTVAKVTEEKVEDQKMKAESGAIVDEDYERTPSLIDRSKEPPLGTLSESAQPTIWKTTFPNDMQVYGIEQKEIPLVYFELNIPAGSVSDTKGKEGTALLTAQVLKGGTANKTPEEFEDALKNLGAQLGISASRTATTISGHCLSKNLPALVELMKEMLLQPRWDEKELERMRQQSFAILEQEKAQPSSIAQKVFLRLEFGDNALIKDTRGNVESLKSITMDDLKAFYAAYYAPNVSKLLITGDTNKASVEAAFSSLSNEWAKKETTPVSIPSVGGTKKEGKIYFVDYPNAQQSVIFLGKEAMTRKDARYYPAMIGNYKLGNGGGSDLFRVLRLERGYTYGAYSDFSCNKYFGLFYASSNVQTTFTKESVDLFKETISNYGAKFTANDLDVTRKAILRQECGANETLYSLIDMLNDVVFMELPENYVQQEHQILKTITPEAIKESIAKEMDFDKMTIVIVGDAKTQLNRLKECGLGEPILITADGKAVK